MPIVRTKEYKEQRSKIASKLWQDPEYRAKMIERQTQLGYRQRF